MARSNINLVDDLSLADYMIIGRGKGKTASYRIGPQMDEEDVLSNKSYKRPYDGDLINTPYWKWRPKRCIGDDVESLGYLVGYMQHISRWEFLRRLENPTAEFFVDEFFEVKFFQGKYRRNRLIEKKEILPDKNGIYHMDFPYKSFEGKPMNHLMIDIKNLDEAHTFYAAMPALVNDFSIFTETLTGGSVEFQPEFQKSSREGKSLPFQLEDYISEFNYEYVPLYFKLIVSASDFEVSSFAQKGLDKPKVDRTVGRGFSDFAVEVSHVNKSDWATQTFEIRFKNPFYSKPPEEV